MKNSRFNFHKFARCHTYTNGYDDINTLRYNFNMLYLNIHLNFSIIPTVNKQTNYNCNYYIFI